MKYVLRHDREKSMPKGNSITKEKKI